MLFDESLVHVVNLLSGDNTSTSRLMKGFITKDVVNAFGERQIKPYNQTL